MRFRAPGNFLGQRLPNLLRPLQALLALLYFIDDSLQSASSLWRAQKTVWYLRTSSSVLPVSFDVSRDDVDLVAPAPLHGVQE